MRYRWLRKETIRKQRLITKLQKAGLIDQKERVVKEYRSWNSRFHEVQRMRALRCD